MKVGAARVGGDRQGVVARRVPLMLMLAVRAGSFGAQTAWLLVIIAAALCLPVVPKVKMHPPQYDMRTRGVVVDRNEDVITYEFTDGKTHGVHTGTGIFRDPREVGQFVTVWYDDFDPSESVLVDTDPYDFGPGSLALLVLPLAALVLVVVTMWKRKKLRLLRYGRAVSARATSADGGDGGRTANIEFRYEIEGTSHKTNLMAIRSPDQLGSTETVLYDPGDPEFAIAIFDLPGAPQIIDNRFSMTRLPIAHFILPVSGLGMLAMLLIRSL